MAKYPLPYWGLQNGEEKGVAMYPLLHQGLPSGYNNGTLAQPLPHQGLQGKERRGYMTLAAVGSQEEKEMWLRNIVWGAQRG